MTVPFPAPRPRMSHNRQNLKVAARSRIENRDMPAARELLLQVCAEKDTDAEAWFLLGFVEAATGATAQAVECLERSVRLDPASARARFQLAVVRAAQGQLTEAAAHFEECLAIDPGISAARLRVSDIYNQQGLQERSGRHLERLLQREPRNPNALIRYAYNRMALGMLDPATKYFNRALQEKPGATMAVAGLSEIYIKQGKPGRAHELLAPFLRHDPVDKGIALNFARICHHGGHCREAVHLLERIRRDMEATTGEPQDILFALGRLYDGLREYDKAFACYSRANSLKHALAGNADVLARATETYINAWSRPFDAGLPRADVRLGQVTPVFIVGMPRSGTSLVEQILASHHAVHGAGELKDIGVLIQQLNEQAGSGLSFPACLQLMGSERLNGFADAYLDKLASLGGAGCLVVTDKMPGNCWNLGLIWHLFPSARIIHCRRDPLDTCLSCFFTDFAEGHQFSYDLAELGGYYKQYRKVMRHWKEVIEVPMLENRYEDLVSNPEAATRRLVEYCGLDWDENCLAPHKTRRAVSTASFTQVREEIYTTSVGRWRHYEKYLGPLRDALDH